MHLGGVHVTGVGLDVGEGLHGVGAYVHHVCAVHGVLACILRNLLRHAGLVHELVRLLLRGLGPEGRDHYWVVAMLRDSAEDHALAC